jgi:hypothetical protein
VSQNLSCVRKMASNNSNNSMSSSSIFYREESQKLAAAGQVFGSHMPLRLQTERQIVGGLLKRPGLPSHNVSRQ